MLRTGALAIALLLAVVRPPMAVAAGPFQRTVITEAGLPAGASTLQGPESKEPQRLVAAALALTLGPFGAHRLYLGTNVKVPLIYGITFGGFGVLAVIDMAHILFTKDLSPYHDNGHVFMWAKPRTETSTPP
ncbi:MAG: TM2 domain-containing protein [Flavobacteriales bacterium]